jgi:hypothetical protein
MPEVKTDPLAERETLLDRLASIDERRLALAEAARAAEVDHLAAERDLAEKRVQEMTGAATAADLKKAYARRDAAKAAADSPTFAEERAAIDRAERQTRAALAGLTRTHHAAFAEHAAQVSADAEAALDALAPALADAAAKWAEARSVWATLAAQEDGGGATRTPAPEALQFGDVPAFPLAVNLSAISARPAEVAANPWRTNG